MAKKHSARLVSISLKIFCDKLEKEIVIDGDRLIWAATEQLCEICGFHGSISVQFECECGKWHKIELKG